MNQLSEWAESGICRENVNVDGVEQRWKTNKAVFERSGRRVRKRYRENGIAPSERALLGEIRAVFPETESEGWRYRAIKVFNEDAGADEVVMEFIEGENLKEAFERTGDPRLFVHGGRWIGALHRGSRSTDGDVLVFNDYNRSNIMINWKTKEVIGLDPGVYDSTQADPGVSFVIGAMSISRGVSLSNPFRFCSAFEAYVSGYLQQCGTSEVPRLRAGLKYLLWRFVSGRSRTVVHRPLWLKKWCGIGECIFLFLTIRFVAVVGRGRFRKERKDEGAE